MIPSVKYLKLVDKRKFAVTLPSPLHGFVQGATDPVLLRALELEMKSKIADYYGDQMNIAHTERMELYP